MSFSFIEAAAIGLVIFLAFGGALAPMIRKRLTANINTVKNEFEVGKQEMASKHKNIEESKTDKTDKTDGETIVKDETAEEK